MPVQAILETSASRSRHQLPYISVPGSASSAFGTSILHTHVSAEVQKIHLIMLASVRNLHNKCIKSPMGMVSSVMASRPQVLIGMYFVIGLDDIGLLCMLLGLLGIHSAGLLDFVRARWVDSRTAKVKASGSADGIEKAPKDKRSAAPTPPTPPHDFLVASAILLGALRLVGPALGLLGTPTIVDCAFVLLVTIAYFPFVTKTSKSKAAVLPAARQEQRRPNMPRQPKPPSATLKSAEVAVPAAVGLAGEIERFVQNALPREQDKVVLRKLTKKASSSVKSVVPEAEVTTIAYTNLRPDATEGVVHDSDCYMVVTCDPAILAARLKEYFLKPQSGRRKSTENLSGSDLRKSATKAFAQRLNFMIFWRCQLGGLDPMVVYVVPDDIANACNRIRVHFIVNCPCHLRLAAVVAEGGLRTKELVLFVVDWAKRRALVNITKGHVHPYAWCLMALHYLQSESKQGQSLPETIRDFVKYLIVALSTENGPAQLCFTSRKHVATIGDVSKACSLPYIEDPRDSCRNVANTLTADGLARVREELFRADAILSKKDASLSQLLERYAGPVAPPSEM